MRDFEDSCERSAATGELMADGAAGDTVVDETESALLQGSKSGQIRS